ncbi:D-serine dehydratase [Salmonella enterica subsp. enterica]|nr:D-serine dehydratase [Salmonella enterica subsp. enterica]
MGKTINGEMLLKKDSHLAISGSIKARGGIYEVLTHAEKLALEAGLLTTDDDYSVLLSPEFKQFFSPVQYRRRFNRQSGAIDRYHERLHRF